MILEYKTRTREIYDREVRLGHLGQTMKKQINICLWLDLGYMFFLKLSCFMNNGFVNKHFNGREQLLEANVICNMF